MDQNMKNTVATLCVGLGLVLSAMHSQAADSCTAVAGNFVANCGFETGTFTGWTLSGNDVPSAQDNLYGVEGADPFPLPGGTAPNNGSFQAFVSDLPSNPTTLSQTFSTAPGSYTVSFYLSQQLVGTGIVNNDLNVSFGGNTLANLTNVGVQGYTKYSFTTNVSSPSSTLSLSMGNEVGEFLLDDVTVTAAVPEPASVTLAACGLGLIGFAAKRRRRLIR
jgi:hypothetical protein